MERIPQLRGILFELVRCLLALRPKLHADMAVDQRNRGMDHPEASGFGRKAHSPIWRTRFFIFMPGCLFVFRHIQAQRRIISRQKDRNFNGEGGGPLGPSMPAQRIGRDMNLAKFGRSIRAALRSTRSGVSSPDAPSGAGAAASFWPGWTGMRGARCGGGTA